MSDHQRPVPSNNNINSNYAAVQQYSMDMYRNANDEVNCEEFSRHAHLFRYQEDVLGFKGGRGENKQRCSTSRRAKSQRRMSTILLSGHGRLSRWIKFCLRSRKNLHTMATTSTPEIRTWNIKTNFKQKGTRDIKITISQCAIQPRVQI